MLLALSGGVDSTAAALLLQEQGYHLIGCTFKTRYSSPASLDAATQLATQLGIEHHIFDYSERFEQTIIQYFRDEYMCGRTPNPCVLCNQKIKFGALLEEADRLHCDKVATGHYAQVVNGQLIRAKDEHKDQTYFLWRLDEQQLNRVVFPLGDITKQEVRAYLAQKGYTALSQAGESQDICFIKDDYRSFLQLSSNPGKYILSNRLAELNNLSPKQTNRLAHNGFAQYTIGQRKGLGVALGEPAFVTHINADTNEVTLGVHDELYTTEVHLRDIVFRGNPEQPVMAQIRYRSLPQEAVLNGATVQFKNPVWAVTPGQSCVFYQANRLVGGGIIV
ncbi:MAG: tRNA 2-thiouridine(34) synthase MnmA [Bacteroidales bacterium]|nr:tRNA 2-thiouridine(34) synthase MnmA [Candidatus Colicola caccequi]